MSAQHDDEDFTIDKTVTYGKTVDQFLEDLATPTNRKQAARKSLARIAYNAGYQAGLKRAAEICNEQYAEIDNEEEKFGQYTDGLLVGLCRAAGSIMREVNPRSPNDPSSSGSPSSSDSKTGSASYRRPRRCVPCGFL